MEFQDYAPGDVIRAELGGLEDWCVLFNEFSILFFAYMKYILVIILLFIGIITLLKFRGIYMTPQIKLASTDKNIGEFQDGRKDPRLVVGFFYIILALGILFNFITYFLIIILGPLPDRLIYNFINFSGFIDSKTMKRIQDINSAIYPHEKTIYYVVALGSLGAFIHLLLSLYILIKGPKNHRLSYINLIASIFEGILCGFTTCLTFLI